MEKIGTMSSMNTWLLFSTAVVFFTHFQPAVAALSFSQQQLLTGGGSFGDAVGVSNDMLLVGAPATSSFAGASVVFQSNGSAWAQIQTLVGNGTVTNDRFGNAISVEGNTSVIGAHESASKIGSAYVYARNGNMWSEFQKLVASDGAADDKFGGSVVISGNTIVVGASSPNTNPGAAYVFTRSGPGVSFGQVQKLLASDSATNNYFGRSVAISGDVMVVGALIPEAAYVFTRNATMVWNQQQRLVPIGGSSGYYGHSVAVSGNTIVVGAFSASDVGSSSGAVYVYEKMGNVWNQTQRLVASDASNQARFGYHVAVIGNTMVIGADQDLSYKGALYVFQRQQSVWVQTQKLVPPGQSLLGRGLAFSGNTIAGGGTQNGEVFVFQGSNPPTGTPTHGPSSSPTGTPTHGPSSSPSMPTTSSPSVPTSLAPSASPSASPTKLSISAAMRCSKSTFAVLLVWVACARMF